MLRNYRATPHSTTRVASATVLFGRPMKTKLPEVTTPCSDAAIRQRDQAAKAKMKEHADNKRFVKPSAIKEGDIVLVKRDETKKKGDTPYNPITRTVIKTKGSMVTAKNAESVPVTKNSSFFKTLPPAKGKRTPTVMVRRRSSVVRLRDAIHTVREHAQPSLLTMFLTDTPLHENSSIRILGLIATRTLSITLFPTQLCLLSGMLYSSFDS